MEGMDILEWIREHEVILTITGVLGVVLFLGSLVVIPVIVACMPEDYFIRLSRRPFPRKPLRQVLHVLKNIFGILLLIAGLLLLLLPGQGLLTMVIGISLIDFPGKHRLQIRIIRQPGIRNSIQWMRGKFGREPLRVP